MSLILTVTVPTVRVRRGPVNSASVVAQAKAGEQYPVVNLIDLSGREQWAKIVFPGRENEDLYICTRLASGNMLCSVSNTPTTNESDDYRRGWNDAVKRLRNLLEGELEK